MHAMMVIVRRELAGFARTSAAYWVTAAVLLVQGLLFNTRAVGVRPKLSSEVLATFLVDSSGTTTVAALLLAIRLFTDERQAGTLALLFTSPIKEWQLVVGKFLSALCVLGAVVLMSLYLPALIFVHGKVSLGHIAGGYLGLLLVGATTLSLGLLASALCRGAMMAGVIGAFFVFLLFVPWTLSRLVQPPISDVISYLSIYEAHFFPFVRGLIQLSDIVFYVSVTVVALVAATRVLQSERFQ